MEIEKIVHKTSLLYSTSAETPTDYELARKIVNSLKVDWKNPHNKYLDPACGRGTFLLALVEKLKEHHPIKHIIKNMVYGVDVSKVQANIARKALYLIADIEPNVYCDDILERNDTMKFDAIVGNPPYQDGTMVARNGRKNTQNKIYYKIVKKCMGLLEPAGIISMLTPEAVAEENKKFTIIQDGLKHVDFSANAHFNVGVKIISWTIEKGYTGPVKIIGSKHSTVEIDSPKIVYDIDGLFDQTFINLYIKCKEVCNDISSRMFMRNNVGNVRSFEETEEFKYPTFKKENNDDILLYYAKKEPYFHNKKKLVIPTTKTFKEENCFVASKTNYDMNYLVIDVKNKQEVENIKSFIFSDYFVNFTAQWKLFKGVGFSESLVYLPPFDKTKHWTNDEVKEFLESFLDK